MISLDIIPNAIFSVLESPAPGLTEATQAYTLEPEEELPLPEMVEATQPYVLSEEDSTPPLDEGGSKEEGDITPPIEEVLAATQNYSLEEEVLIFMQIQ